MIRKKVTAAKNGNDGILPIINDDNPYAFHPGGVETVMGDGSVTFMEENVDSTVFAALVSRDGGESVTGP